MATSSCNMNRLANLDRKKLYKEKFKIWGWQKNLPGAYAQWMTQKANKRKRDVDKETVFFYGGLQWDKSRAERSAVRSKKVSAETEVIGEHMEKPWHDIEILLTISKLLTHRMISIIKHREMMSYRHRMLFHLGALGTTTRQATLWSDQKTL